jgi:hypothetical protein
MVGEEEVGLFSKNNGFRKGAGQISHLNQKGNFGRCPHLSVPRSEAGA